MLCDTTWEHLAAPHCIMLSLWICIWIHLIRSSSSAVKLTFCLIFSDRRRPSFIIWLDPAITHCSTLECRHLEACAASVSALCKKKINTTGLFPTAVLCCSTNYESTKNVTCKSKSVSVRDKISICAKRCRFSLTPSCDKSTSHHCANFKHNASHWALV